MTQRQQENNKKNWTLFLSVIGAIALTGGFIFSVFTSDRLTEAPKYFSITLLLLTYMMVYIELVVKRRKYA